MISVPQIRERQKIRERQIPDLTRLEIFAGYERHMRERDALISERLCCSPAYWAAKRESGGADLLFWEMMERKALRTPPRLRSSQVAAQRREQFGPGEFTRWSQSSEYLRWSERRLTPAASRRDWLGCGLILLVAGVFFGERVPGVHSFVTEFVRGLFQ